MATSTALKEVGSIFATMQNLAIRLRSDPTNHVNLRLAVMLNKMKDAVVDDFNQIIVELSN